MPPTLESHPPWSPIPLVDPSCSRAPPQGLVESARAPSLLPIPQLCAPYLSPTGTLPDASGSWAIQARLPVLSHSTQILSDSQHTSHPLPFYT